MQLWVLIAKPEGKVYTSDSMGRELMVIIY